MQISLQDFEAYVDRHLLHKLGLHAVPAFHKRTQQFYCQPLTLRGACTRQCSTCILAVRERLESTSWRDVRRPYGLFTYILKDLAAKAAERRSQEEKPVRIEETEGDVFDLLLEKLS